MSNVSILIASGLCGLAYPIRIFALILSAVLLVNPLRRWINRLTIEEAERPGPASFRWLRRPSGLLMIIGVGSYTYWGLYDPCPAPVFPFFFGVAAILLSFFIRHWEEEAEAGEK
jgi:hypothetical protein